MDTQTRHALKGDKFAQATKTSVTWLTGHRTVVVRWTIAAAVVLAVCLGALLFSSIESAKADKALGAALDIYSAPLAVPGVPPVPGEYTSSKERAAAANKEFLEVARQYGWFSDGAKAHYFAGVTYEQLGQNGPAESELKIAAGSWNHNLANLAKLALAGLYQQTGRDDQAIALYNELIARPSETVTAPVAQLNLADLYAATGKTEQARILWAKVKDADKDGAAGSIAGQKLGGGQ